MAGVIDKKLIHDALWKVWSQPASGESRDRILAAATPAVADLREALASGGRGDVLVGIHDDWHLLRLCAWATFGNDTTPLLPPAEREQKLASAAESFELTEDSLRQLVVFTSGWR